MASRNPFRRIRLKYRRSSTLVKCMVLAMVVVCTAALLTLRFALLDTKQQLDQKRNEAALLEQENKALERSISQLGSVQSVIELAGELLDLVDPDTVFFTPEQ